MKLLTIVIISYNLAPEIERLVNQLQQEEIKGWSKEVIVVDNNSDVQTVMRLKELEKKKKIGNLISNSRNEGFTSAANKGIKSGMKQKADRILLLNQDIEIEKGQLDYLMNNNGDIVAPVIKFQRNKQWIYDYGGRVNFLIGRTYHIEKTSYKSQSVSDKLDYVSGCCMLIKSRVFEKIGLPDEKYFMYFEDADFCLRAQKAGFSTRIESKYVITHHLQEGHRKKFKQHMYLLASNYRFITKYVNPLLRPIAYIYLALLYMKILFNHPNKLRVSR